MIRVRSLIYIAAFVIMLIPGTEDAFRYLDEILTLTFLLMLLKRAVYKDFWKQNREIPVIFASLGVLLFTGMIASMLSGLHQPVFGMAIDAFSMLKYPIAYLGVKYCIYARTKQEFFEVLYLPAAMMIVAAFVTGLLNFVLDFGMSYDVRYGIRSFCFIYDNPGNLGAVMFSCMAILAMHPKKQGKRWLIFLAEAVVVFTLRGGCIGALGALIVAQLFLRKSLKLHHMVLAGLAAVALGYEQLNQYILKDDSLRKELIRGGLTVYKQYRPWGAGFASFGSDMAYKYYSPLYYQLGYHHKWGFNHQNGSYVNDNFWPMVLGQFGILGVCSYLVILYAQFREIMSLRVSRERKCQAFAIFVLLLIGSIGAALYTGSMGVQLGMVLGMLESSEEEEW